MNLQQPRVFVTVEMELADGSKVTTFQVELDNETVNLIMNKPAVNYNNPYSGLEPTTFSVGGSIRETRSNAQ